MTAFPEIEQGSTEAYWEARAQRFAEDGEGLRAVCSYGMPWLYNQSIEWTQRRALSAYLRPPIPERVLEIGCGVGRWSLRMARAGAHVTGVDLSPKMVDTARYRAEQRGLSDRIELVCSDVTTLDLGRRFPRILSVTVLQHVLEAPALTTAIENLEGHLEPGGQMVLLEAMPTTENRRCDSPVFRARTYSEYREIFERCNLRVASVRGVDPAFWRYRFLPLYRRLPPSLARPVLAALTATTLPYDLLLGATLTSSSWHKLVVLEHRVAP